MFEKDMHLSLLMDTYGALLSERKRELMSYYYDEDYSLAEIAEITGISRQGIRDSVKKSEAELRELEEKLNKREMVIASKGDSNFIPLTQEVTDVFEQEAICPIICEGDIIGGVILIDNGEKGKMGEVEQKLIQSAAGFLGRQMEQ